ncbi:fluoride efflux transporter CrcB [Xinfangfangia sp. CPCC 101601]|uniref:Fluoride-specific ion channel FluC n=1 Tax=Pseudogemmobacter lacusdianii TaxID=3069608 RepID=A0ABU0W0F8_9RHOB|nr:fluoride efflux transporter CrcB [Xinfangfangia sp. CPCC 101601]MDQ2067476.1 fluoride efflux transporter CrcB [Xinfangfangia sp. CPCC 101601]
MFTLSNVLQVALGGALGSVLRFGVTTGTTRLFGVGFPWGTMIVNVIGSFAMGLLLVLLTEREAARLSPLLLTGLLGGFTTFSAFSLDSLTLWQRGDILEATAYIAASVLLSLAAIALALHLFRGAFA